MAPKKEISLWTRKDAKSAHEATAVYVRIWLATETSHLGQYNDKSTRPKTILSRPMSHALFKEKLSAKFVEGREGFFI